VVNLPDCQIVVADIDYDSYEFKDYIASLGYDSKIPRKLNKKRGNAQMDWCLYRYRYLVENTFMKTKRFRAIATRYDNLAGNYEATVSLAFTMMWLPMSVD
jgi:transposase